MDRGVAFLRLLIESVPHDPALVRGVLPNGFRGGRAKLAAFLAKEVKDGFPATPEALSCWRIVPVGSAK